MPRPLRSLSLVLALAAAGPLGAATPALAAGTLSSTDRDYLQDDAKGAAYELALAKLAAERASQPRVKAFAAGMASDHEAYNAALLALGKEKGLDLSKAMGTVDEVKLAAVKALSGSLFDKAFLEQAASINADDIKDADKEKTATADPQIKAFIEKFSSLDKRHEADAEALRK